MTTGPKLWIIIARAHAALAAFVEQHIAAEGLCLSDFMVLEVLLHKGPRTMSGIAEKVLLANASMTSAIDRLEARAFVKRTSQEKDRRVRMVELTEAGEVFITALYARHEREIDSLFSVLDEGEREPLRASLKKLGLAAQASVSSGEESPIRK